MYHHLKITAVAASLLAVVSAQDQLPYQPCPLLRAYYPLPSINKSSSAIQAASVTFKGLFDNLIQTGCSDDFGCISPNTTSFSVVLFSGDDAAADDAIFFDYSHTVPDLTIAGSNVGLDTIFPAGTLTQVFTVYAWLIQLGDGHWADSITAFLPELATANVSTSAGDLLAVDWNGVTVGALAGHMSGIIRDSYACELSHECNYQAFIDKMAGSTPYVLPDTTPILSNAAFQLLAFALERSSQKKGNGTDFSSIMTTSFLQPLNMTQSGLLSPLSEAGVFEKDLKCSALGEPAALSLLTTTRDLARAGRAMLSSRLVSAATTRRWLQPIADTSNLRNGVGRPWEIYHAGQYANSTILDIYTKPGSVGAYASYFGLSPDLGAGFAILAHDTSGTAPDLNAYADIVSLAILNLASLAADEAAAQFSGNFTGTSPGGGSGDDTAVIQAPSDGYGFVVAELVVDGVDLRNQTAAAAGIALENIDFRVYPSNVVQGITTKKRVFVAVFQDKNASSDAGTPTCITWEDVGSLGQDIADQFVFEVDEVSGVAKSLTVLGKSATLIRTTST